VVGSFPIAAAADGFSLDQVRFVQCQELTGKRVPAVGPDPFVEVGRDLLPAPGHTYIRKVSTMCACSREAGTRSRT
jgi:hypothetical protein